MKFERVCGNVETPILLSKIFQKLTKIFCKDLLQRLQFVGRKALLLSLRKIPYFHLITWCGNFVESHSFRIVSGDSPETMQ